MLPFLVPVLFTFYLKGVLKLKKKIWRQRVMACGSKKYLGLRLKTQIFYPILTKFGLSKDFNGSLQYLTKIRPVAAELINVNWQKDGRTDRQDEDNRRFS
jgi:hypothetical protein